MKKVYIVNAHWNNHGDEAAIKALIREIWKINPNHEIKMLIKDKSIIDEQICIDGKIIRHEEIQFLPNLFDMIIQVLSKGKIGFGRKMKNYIMHIKEADYLIYAPGGSVINDRFWWRKQLEYMLPIIYASKHKIPLYIASPSIGPFEINKKIKNIFRRRVFNKLNYFFVREEKSEQYLKEINADKKVSVTVDLALIDETNLVEKNDKLIFDTELNQFLRKYNKVIGLTITELNWNVKFKEQFELPQKIESVMRKFISKLDKENIGIILIPQLFINQDDESLLIKYQNQNTFILNKDYDSDFQQYLISQLYMVVGFRYHSNIFAAKMGVPFLPIIYEEKMESFLKSYGLDKYGIDVDEISIAKIWNRYKKIENDREQYRINLLNLKKKWQVKVEIIKASLKDFLED